MQAVARDAAAISVRYEAQIGEAIAIRNAGYIADYQISGDCGKELRRGIEQLISPDGDLRPQNTPCTE